MELQQGENGNGKWYWQDGYCTSQEFDTKEDALEAMEKEREKAAQLGLDIKGNASAGVLDWTY